MSEIQDFKVDIPREEVDRLRRKLKDTRLPGRPVVPDAGKNYGEITVYMKIKAKPD